MLLNARKILCIKENCSTKILIIKITIEFYVVALLRK